MYCMRCGNDLAEDQSVCARCGTPRGTAPAAFAALPSRPLRLERPGFVTLLAVLDLASGGALLLGGSLIAGLNFAAGAVRWPVVLGAILAVVGATLLTAGHGLWRLAPHGRRLQIATSVLALPLLPFGTVIGILALVYLYRPGVKVLFAGKAIEALDESELSGLRALAGSSFGVLAAVVIAVLAFLVVPMVGIVAAIAIPNLIQAVSRGKQKRTMSDLRVLGTAIESYLVDHDFVPDIPSGADAAAALAPVLAPAYIKDPPRHDGWMRPFAWRHDADGYSLISLGKDGLLEPEPEPGATTSFDADIYFANGSFVRYPEGTQH